MRIIISPAKKMRVDTDTLAVRDLPCFLDQAEQLTGLLREKSYAELKALWRCGDAIAALNVRRLEGMDLRRGLTPALLAYEGIQYQYMASTVLTREEYAYLQTHLRILSGLYGILRPFDGVVPYRLEMQARLSGPGFSSLYQFWGDLLAQSLAEETDLVLDLASQEYSRAVLPHLPPSVRVVSCVFGEEMGGRVVEKGTLCKMARGEMVRWAAVNRLEDTQALFRFQALGYAFAPERSSPDRLVFLRKAGSRQPAAKEF